MSSSHVNDSNDQSYTILQAASISAQKYTALTGQGNSVKINNGNTPCGDFKMEFNPMHTYNSNTLSHDGNFLGNTL
jgi:hypothetical protein